jgi:ATP-dependent Lhr-like helicase
MCGAISSDQTVLVEVFDDAMGDPLLVVHSPFGGRVNGPWAWPGCMLRERSGIDVEHQRRRYPAALPGSGGRISARPGIALGPAAPSVSCASCPTRRSLARNSARTARACSCPACGEAHAPWLQRLRADRLETVRRFRFPIAASLPDCLQDVLDLPHLEEVLSHIQTGYSSGVG